MSARVRTTDGGNPRKTTQKLPPENPSSPRNFNKTPPPVGKLYSKPLHLSVFEISTRDSNPDVSCYIGVKVARRLAIGGLLRYNWIARPKSVFTKIWAVTLKSCLYSKPRFYEYENLLPRIPLPSVRHTIGLLKLVTGPTILENSGEKRLEEFNAACDQMIEVSGKPQALLMGPPQPRILPTRGSFFSDRSKTPVTRGVSEPGFVKNHGFLEVPKRRKKKTISKNKFP